MTIDNTEFNKIVERESAMRDSLPEYTLDWYTYGNRVTLLNEVAALFTDDKKTTPKKAAKTAVESDKTGYFAQ